MLPVKHSLLLIATFNSRDGSGGGLCVCVGGGGGGYVFKFLRATVYVIFYGHGWRGGREGGGGSSGHVGRLFVVNYKLESRSLPLTLHFTDCLLLIVTVVTV